MSSLTVLPLFKLSKTSKFEQGSFLLLWFTNLKMSVDQRVPMRSISTSVRNHPMKIILDFGKAFFSVSQLAIPPT